MKSVLIGVVAALAVAFAAHAAYTNFAAGNNNRQAPAATSAQQVQTANVVQEAPVQAAPQPVAQTAVTASASATEAPVVLQSANTATLAAAPRRVVNRPAASNQPANRTAAKKTTTTIQKPVAAQQQTAVKPVATPVQTRVATQTRPTTTTYTNRVASTANANVAETSFDNPNSVAEYDFAFVDPQAVAVDPMTEISAAAEQAVQNVYEETVLSPSAPR